MTEDEVIATRDPRVIKQYATQNKDANVAKLEAALLSLNDFYYVYYFATDVKGANVSLIEQWVVKNAPAAFWFYYFAKNVQGSDRDLLGEAVRKSNDSPTILQFLNLKISDTLREKLEKQLTISRLLQPT